MVVAEVINIITKTVRKKKKAQISTETLYVLKAVDSNGTGEAFALSSLDNLNETYKPGDLISITIEKISVPEVPKQE